MGAWPHFLIQNNFVFGSKLLNSLPTSSITMYYKIEVSKFYEKLPKAHAMAIENWLSEKIYFRNTESKE